MITLSYYMVTWLGEQDFVETVQNQTRNGGREFLYSFRKRFFSGGF
jgi:hypothetical protein